MTGIVSTLAGWFAPWQAVYSDSKTIDTAVTGVHIVALLFAGGLAISADRDTLRAMRAGGTMSTEGLARLRRTHRPVLIAMAVLFASGLALAASDIKTFSQTPTFYIKLGFVALLCCNGLFLVRTERLLDARDAAGANGTLDPPAGLWRRLRVATWLSLTLWTCTAIAGTALANS